MSAIDQLLRLTKAYQEATGLTEATVSTHIFNDGKKLGSIRTGGDLSTKRYEETLRLLSARWPENCEWPADIDRPSTPAPVQDAAA